MVIFQYNLYIFWIHLWTALHPKPCYNKPVIKKNDHKWSFYYIIYTFVFGFNTLESGPPLNWFYIWKHLGVRLGVDYAMHAESLEGGPLMWMLPLYLHIKKSGDDDDDEDDDNNNDDLMYRLYRKMAIIIYTIFFFFDTKLFGPSLNLLT